MILVSLACHRVCLSGVEPECPHTQKGWVVEEPQSAAAAALILMIAGASASLECQSGICLAPEGACKYCIGR
jgi:hypothetical protein